MILSIELEGGIAMYRIAMLMIAGLVMGITGMAGASPASASAQAPPTVAKPCIPDPSGSPECYEPDLDPGPKPPPCNLDAPPGLVQGPCPTVSYMFEADDPAQRQPEGPGHCLPDAQCGPYVGDVVPSVEDAAGYPSRRSTVCTVKLDGATPFKPFPGVGHNLQYRANVSCDGPIQKITFTTHAYSGAPDAGGRLIGSGPTLSCYDCSTAGASRGADVAIDEGQPYTIRAHVRFLAPESVNDPWIAFAGTFAADPDRCTSGREDIECNLDLPIRTQ